MNPLSNQSQEETTSHTEPGVQQQERRGHGLVWTIMETAMRKAIEGTASTQPGADTSARQRHAGASLRSCQGSATPCTPMLWGLAWRIAWIPHISSSLHQQRLQTVPVSHAALGFH